MSVSLRDLDLTLLICLMHESRFTSEMQMNLFSLCLYGTYEKPVRPSLLMLGFGSRHFDVSGQTNILCSFCVHSSPLIAAKTYRSSLLSSFGRIFRPFQITPLNVVF